MQSPLISIIIPCYNVSQYIVQCLDSVDCQTYENYEVILVDDGSLDDTAAKIQQYIKNKSNYLLIQRENGGAAAARNDGILAARGEWITFVDGDDWIEPEYLSTMIDPLLLYPADICIVGAMSFTESGEEQIYRPATLEKAVMTPERLKKEINIFEIWGCLYNHVIINKNNLSFSEVLPVCEDTLFNLQYFCYVNKFVSVDSYCYHYRINPLGLSHGKHRKMVTIDYIRELNSLFNNEKPNIVNSAFPQNERLIRAFGESVVNACRTQVDLGKAIDLELLNCPFVKQVEQQYVPLKSKKVFWYLLKKKYFILFAIYQKTHSWLRNVYFMLLAIRKK